MQIIGLTLEEWSKDGYYQKSEVCDRILKSRDPNFKDTIERIHVDEYTIDEFLEKFERGSRPVIIQGLVQRWPALESWQPKVPNL